MTKKTHTTHGIATTDAKVALPYKQAITATGWLLQTIKKQHYSLSDKDIATIYGRNKSVLITNDKRAHIHNVTNGFIGYIYIDSSVTRTEEPAYLELFKVLLLSLKSSDVMGKCIYLDKSSQLPQLL